MILTICYKWLSVFGVRCSAISYQLSAISYQPSAVSRQPSAISYQRSAVSGQLSAAALAAKQRRRRIAARSASPSEAPVLAKRQS